MIDIVHTQNNSYFCPNIKIRRLEPNYTIVPLRGYASNVAVFNSDKKCIGWMHVDDLGFHSVIEWIKATGWKDMGL